MISAVHCLLCASVTLLLWTSVGFAVARRVLPGQKLAMAPALGYALFNAVALPLCAVVGVTPLAARLVLAVALLSALLSIARNIPDTLPPRPIMPAPALMLAALLALVPMLAVLPKSGALGIDFAIQIFDHSKVALIDQITRSGVPPTNPFYGATGGPQGVAYYYLWHFGAALMAALPGIGCRLSIPVVSVKDPPSASTSTPKRTRLTWPMSLFVRQSVKSASERSSKGRKTLSPAALTTASTRPTFV